MWTNRRQVFNAPSAQLGEHVTVTCCSGGRPQCLSTLGGKRTHYRRYASLVTPLRCNRSRTAYGNLWHYITGLCSIMCVLLVLGYASRSSDLQVVARLSRAVLMCIAKSRRTSLSPRWRERPVRDACLPCVVCCSSPFTSRWPVWLAPPRCHANQSLPVPQSLSSVGCSFSSSSSLNSLHSSQWTREQHMSHMHRPQQQWVWRGPDTVTQITVPL